MILVEETIRRFGYDPTLIGVTTGKKIVRKCDGCGSISVTTRQSADCLCHSCGKKKAWVGHKARAANDPSKAFWVRSRGKTKRLVCQCGTVEEIASVSRTLCLSCSNTKVDEVLAGLKKSVPVSSLAVAETIKRFGYDPLNISKWSKLYVVSACGECGDMREVRIDGYRKLCMNCAVHLDQEMRREAFGRVGLTPKGNDPSALQRTGNEWHKAFHAGRRATEIGRLRGILYATLGGYLHGRIKVSRNLPYTAVQLREHIENEILKFDSNCPMCESDLIRLGYDIDHKIPTSAAKTVDEMKAAFDLSNLSVLCQDCNRRVKKAKIVTYDEIRKINKEAVVAVLVNG